MMVKLLLIAVFLLTGVGVHAQDPTPPELVVISGDNRIESPLTTQAPDPFRGLDIFINVKLGNCVACHSNFDVAAMQFLGEIGPNLDWIGDRLSEAELRAILVDSKAVLGADTIMPAFYTARAGNRTLERFVGKTILTAMQVEDVVAYLSSLSKDTAFDGVD
jgi:sulfur-oxidizing protein SoxX